MVKNERAPARELSTLAKRLDYGFHVYAKSTALVLPRADWEAPRHAWALHALMKSHSEAVTLLARTSVAHAPTAWVAARSCVEIAARLHWLLGPTDDWDREARWVALLKEGGRLGQQQHVSWLDVLVERSDSVRGFANAVHSSLPKGLVVPGIPSTHDILAPIDPGLDAFYAVASQFAHGTEYATAMFRSSHSSDAIFGDRSSEVDWIIPLTNIWQAYRLSAVRLIELGAIESADQTTLADVQIEEAFQNFITALDLV